MNTEYKLSYTAAQIDKKLGEIDNMVKSVNNITPDENGNVEIVINNETVDLSGYATEEYVNNLSMYKPFPIYKTTEFETVVQYFVNIMDMEMYVPYALPSKLKTRNTVMISFGIICEDDSELVIVNNFPHGCIGAYVAGNDSYRALYSGQGSNIQYKVYLDDLSTKTNVRLERTDNVRYLDSHNVYEYIPELDYNPATKKYVDDSIQNMESNSFPEAIENALAQAKASGEFNGTDYILTEDDKTEIAQAAGELINVPEKTSELENDSGFITADDIPESGISVKLTKAFSDFFTNLQTLLPQLAYIEQDHIGATLVSNAKTLVKILNNVPLTNLTATYSGGYVTIGTDLDNLRKYIAVTGTYTDGTVATIIDYELSGTIIDGESVLTVTSGDISTTVSVTGTPNTYLYSNGFEYTDVTGGWVNEGNIGYTELTEISKDNNSLYIKASKTTTTGNPVNTYATKNTIDLTKYSKFVVDGEFTISGTNGSSNIRATSTLNTDLDFTVAYEKSVVVFNAAKSTTTNGVFEVDLSTIDFSALDASKVYIALSAGVWTNNTNASCNVRNIYLVPKAA